MRQKVEFQTNVPQILRLDFNEGVLKPSAKGYGDEYQYVLNNDAAIMWVKPELHALIQRTGAKAGDEICITRREVKAPGSGRKTVDWEVQLVCEEPEPPTPAASPRTESPAAASARPSEAVAPQGQPEGITDPAAEGALTRALCTALAAARSAELYAARLGMAVRFTGEDVRCLAITNYIAANKGDRR